MKENNILITGNAGMLGSSFADWILKHTNYHVIGIDDLSGGYLDNIDSRVEFYLRDCGSDLTDIFENNKIKYCFHFGCWSAEGASPFMRKFNYTNNLVTTANIVNFCITYKVKLIYASSMSVYGNINTPPFKETDPLFPYDPYANSKIACERDIIIANQQHGMKYAIIRPHNIIGKKQNLFDKYRNCVGIFMRQIINNQPITIYGDGNQRRAFSYVNDYCPIFLKVAENDYPDPIFNCGGDVDYSLNELVSLLLEVVGKPNHPVVHLEPRHEVLVAFCDHSKVKSVVGFEDKTTLKEMLTEMWEWAKVQPTRPVKSFDNIELKEGLYEFWK